MEILTIPLTAILVEDRLRAVDPDRASELAVSFREAGQITPIEVAPEDKNGMHRLIAGAHRVAAAKLAGLGAIRAVVFEGSADAGRLREIDENLYRRELSPLDQAAFLAERRAIYERLFGPVKAGKRNRAKFAQLNFFDDVTAKFGLGKRLVQLALWRRNAIQPAVWAMIAGSRIGENGAMLDAIGRLDTPTQAQVVQMLLSPSGPKTVAAALQQIGRAPVVDEGRRQMQALMSAWDKAAVPARTQFLAHLVRQHRPGLLKALKAEGAA